MDIFAKGVGKACLKVLLALVPTKEEAPSKYFEGVSGGDVHGCAGRV
jgi:hypothetical protein